VLIRDACTDGEPTFDLGCLVSIDIAAGTKGTGS
jgi:hypothetical protein